MPDGGIGIEIEVLGGLDQISPADWDSCAAPEAADGGRPEHPLLTWRFLRALEESGSVGQGTGWIPRHLVAKASDRVGGGALIGVMPLYAKGHSQGEYVFDHSWAHAFENAGGRYYPKLQCAVPFTPVAGLRFLTNPKGPLPREAAIAALTQGAVRLASQMNVSSLHLTFCKREESEAGGEMGLLQRTGQQFFWRNRHPETGQPFADFDDFLASLASRKRKAIRRERRQANANVDVLEFTGDAIEPEHWGDFWRFYQDTGARKWGSPYLTREFFDIAQETLRDDMLLIMARREGEFVAGALNVIGRDALFGRYWGCVEHHPCLHFELCYYRAINYALSHGLGRVEAGAQGEHKLARGYLPEPTYSLHWFADQGFRRAVGEYLERERDAVGEEIDFLTEFKPFRRGD